VESVEKIIKYLEYSISMAKWAINSLRSFPIFKEEIKHSDTKSILGE
jgi:hypothetical protein